MLQRINPTPASPGNAFGPGYAAVNGTEKRLIITNTQTPKRTMAAPVS